MGKLIDALNRLTGRAPKEIEHQGPETTRDMNTGAEKYANLVAVVPHEKMSNYIEAVALSGNERLYFGEHQTGDRGQIAVYHDGHTEHGKEEFAKTLKEVERGTLVGITLDTRHKEELAPAEKEASERWARDIEAVYGIGTREIGDDEEIHAKEAKAEAMAETWANQAIAKAAQLEQERNPRPYVLETRDGRHYEAFDTLKEAAGAYASMEERSGKVLKEAGGLELAHHRFNEGGFPGNDSCATKEVRDLVMEAEYGKHEIGDDDHEMGI